MRYDGLRDDSPALTRGHIVIGEPGTDFGHIAVYDSQEKIEFCLECPKEDCTGYCPFQRVSLRRKIAEKYLYGWRIEALATEFGLTVKAVQALVREARKDGLL